MTNPNSINYYKQKWIVIDSYSKLKITNLISCTKILYCIVESINLSVITLKGNVAVFLQLPIYSLISPINCNK